jgi:hypothetical protein
MEGRLMLRVDYFDKRSGIRCEREGCECRQMMIVERALQLMIYLIPRCCSGTIKTLIQRQVGALLSEWRRFQPVGVVRNPWDRMLSNYEWFCKTPDTLEATRDWLSKILGADTASLSFEEFLRRAEQHREHHWEECSAFLPPGSRIVRFENFQVEFSALMQEAHYPVKVGVRENIRTRVPEATYWTPETVGIVERMFPNDIARYGYTKPE